MQDVLAPIFGIATDLYDAGLNKKKTGSRLAFHEDTLAARIGAQRCRFGDGAKRVNSGGLQKGNLPPELNRVVMSRVHSRYCTGVG